MSLEAVTTRAPSGENAALNPILVALEHAIAWPVAASQTRAVMSKDAVTTRAPSGENAALRPSRGP